MNRPLISYRLAVAVIALLFGASLLGWIITEFIPGDVPSRHEVYRERWGDTRLSLVENLELYDPFHSYWFRAVLLLFLVVLSACLVSRWRSFLIRPFRVEPPEGARELGVRKLSIQVSWREALKGDASRRDILAELERRYGREGTLGAGAMRTAFDRISAFLRGKGYRVSETGSGGEIRFAAVSGRWRYFGGFLFHLGILIITVGGMLGSFWGETEILYGTDGDILPLRDGTHSILVEGFDIVMNGAMEVKEYVSSVSVVDTAGRRLATTTVEVNEPLHFGRYDIFQSSYYVEEDAFRWARVEYAYPSNPIDAVVRLEPDREFTLQGFPVTIRAKRFFPDFRVGPHGPFSETSDMYNPALEVELAGEGRTEEGWLFLYYPRLNSRFDFPVRLTLADVAPVYYTGLQISTNPGSTLLLTGIALATAGLALLYLLDYRCIKGVVSAERLTLAGTNYRWKVSFGREFERITAGVIDAVSGVRGSNM
jgi:cytochrome c biogenesis protein